MPLEIENTGAIQGGICQLDRYYTNVLATKLREFTPDIDTVKIEKFLEDEVNFKPPSNSEQPTDKVLKEHREQYTADNSISAMEAMTFIKRMIEGKGDGSSFETAVKKGLENIYFGGSLFRELAPHVVEIISFHDGDTPMIKDSQDESCNTGAFATTSVRISGTDAPEVGAAAYAKWIERNADPRLVEDVALGKKGGGWVNQKLVDNVKKVHAQISEGKWDPKKLSPKELIAINKIIAFTIDYTGQLSTIAVAESFLWGRDASEKGKALAEESRINWMCSDTPNVLCGMWQSYDVFSRRLLSLNDMEGARLARYIRKGLPEIMAERGAQIFEGYRAQMKENLNTLSRSKVNGLFDAAREMVEGAPDPAKIYSANNCERMAKVFESLSSEVSKDTQAMQIITGTVYDYQKYGNQSRRLYKAAGEIAMAEGFGFWTEISFRSLFDYNMKTDKKRYDPPECTKP